MHYLGPAILPWSHNESDSIVMVITIYAMVEIEMLYFVASLNHL